MTATESEMAALECAAQDPSEKRWAILGIAVSGRIPAILHQYILRTCPPVRLFLYALVLWVLPLYLYVGLCPIARVPLG